MHFWLTTIFNLQWVYWDAPHYKSNNILYERMLIDDKTFISLILPIILSLPSSHLQMAKLRLWEVKQLDKGPTANKCQIQDSNPILSPNSILRLQRRSSEKDKLHKKRKSSTCENRKPFLNVNTRRIHWGHLIEFKALYNMIVFWKTNCVHVTHWVEIQILCWPVAFRCDPRATSPLPELKEFLQLWSQECAASSFIFSSFHPSLRHPNCWAESSHSWYPGFHHQHSKREGTWI